jgi:hypothetical protein
MNVEGAGMLAHKEYGIHVFTPLGHYNVKTDFLSTVDMAAEICENTYTN